MNKFFTICLLTVGFITIQLSYAADPISLNGSTTTINTTGSTVTTFKPAPLPPQVIVSALNDEINVDTSKNLTGSGNATKNDRYTIDAKEQNISLGLLSSAAGAYGFLQFNSTGEFTYVLDNSSPAVLALKSGEVREENFEYYIQGYPNVKAFIRVRITGNPTAVRPLNDEVSVDSVTKLTAAGDVTANDNTDSNAAKVASVSLLSPPTTPYGFLNIDSTGKFTYTVYDKADIVRAIKAGETVKDVFSYKAVSLNGASSAIATLTVYISGNPAPNIIARDDEVTVNTNSASAETEISITGDVTTNDLYFDVKQYSIALNSPIVGNFGFLTLETNGKFKYTLLKNKEEVLNLKLGQAVNDTFSYKIQGTTIGANLIVNIVGNASPATLPKAIDDTATLVIDAKNSTSTVDLNIMDNDINVGSVVLKGSPLGQFGAIVGSLSKDGKLTYQLDTRNSAVQNAIRSGSALSESFSYTAYGKAPNQALTADGRFTIYIVAGALSLPKAMDDNATVIIDPTTAKAEVELSIMNNDSNVGSVALSSSLVGQYGAIIGSVNAEGKLTYRVDLKNANVLNLIKFGGSLTDSFSYTAYGKEPNQSISSQATINISIVVGSSGLPAPKPLDDNATLLIDSAASKAEIELNIMSNDSNVGSVALSSSLIGQYGTIIGSVSADGKLTYRVDLKNANVLTLIKAGGSLTDRFSYTAYGKEPNQHTTAQGSINISIVVGNSSFKAFDFVETIVGEDGAVPVSGDLLTYNNNLLNSKDTSTRTELLSSQIGKYGALQFSSASNKFTYALNNNVPEISALRDTDNQLQEIFKYRLTNSLGQIADANIIINIVSRRDQLIGSIDNVEIEANNNSNNATPLNTGKYMRGNLMNFGDRDWFSLTSAGNETLHIELCPQGFGCYNQGAWVLYVFDGDRLTQEMQNSTVPIRLTRDDTGATLSSYQEDHMYLLYDYGKFDDALLGVINPCWPAPAKEGLRGGRTSVDIGLPVLPPGSGRTYYVAISAPLARSGSSTSGSTCSDGRTVLTKPGNTFKDRDPTDATKLIDVKTTQEYISTFPNSDDQYTFKVSRTGISPLSPDTATFDSSTGNAQIPKVRVADQVFSVGLQLGLTPRSSNSAMPSFSVTEFKAANNNTTNNATLGVFNPGDNVLRLPRVTVDNKASYSVDLRYFPDNTLELKSVTPLQ